MLKADAIHHLGRLGPDAESAVEAIQRADLDNKYSVVARAALKRIAPNAKPISKKAKEMGNRLQETR